MKAKHYNDFFLLSTKEPGTDETEGIKPVNEEYFQVQPLPALFRAKKCLRDRKDKDIQIMTVIEIRKAA